MLLRVVTSLCCSAIVFVQGGHGIKWLGICVWRNHKQRNGEMDSLSGYVRECLLDLCYM
jgi:hypothetical protein